MKANDQAKLSKIFACSCWNIKCFIKVCFAELRMWKRLDFNGNNIVSLAEAGHGFFQWSSFVVAVSDELGLYTLDILGIFMSILIFHELGIPIHQVSLGNFFNRFMTERVFGRL